MSLNFDAVGELLEDYETIQPAQWKSRVYPIPQPLFFSTSVPVQQPESTEEVSMPSMADWVYKKI